MPCYFEEGESTSSHVAQEGLVAELPSLEPGLEWQGEISASGHGGGEVALEGEKSQARGQKSTRQV